MRQEKDENTQEDSGRLVSFPMRFRAGGAGVSTSTLGKYLDQILPSPQEPQGMPIGHSGRKLIPIIDAATLMDVSRLRFLQR